MFGKGSKSRNHDSDGLLGALIRLVQRAQNILDGLLESLVMLVDAATAGRRRDLDERNKNKQEQKQQQGAQTGEGQANGSNADGPGKPTGKAGVEGSKSALRVPASRLMPRQLLLGLTSSLERKFQGIVRGLSSGCGPKIGVVSPFSLALIILGPLSTRQTW